MSKLHDFAQAVGADIKEIKTTLAGKADKGSEGITEELWPKLSHKLRLTSLVELPKTLTHSRKLLITSKQLVAMLIAASLRR